MKYYELDAKEQEELEAIENALEAGNLNSAPEFEKRKRELQQIAKNTLNKTRNIKN